MSAKTMLFTAVLFGLGLAGRSRATEPDVRPSPKGEAFDRIDLNHDGVIQRDEFEQARQLRGQRRAERGDGERARGRFGGGESFERRIDEAIDRALEQSGGDPSALRQALREELKHSMRQNRGRRGPGDGAPNPPDANDVEGRPDQPPSQGPPPARPRGFSERRGPRGSDGDEEFRQDPRGRGPGARGRGGFRHVEPDQRAEKVMERLDSNRDGAITPDELDGDRGQRLMKADANGDGRVDQTELVELFKMIREEAGRRHRGGEDAPKGTPPPAP